MNNRLEKISELTLEDAFFIVIERLDLVDYYYLSPDRSKNYYNRLIVINKEKPTLEIMQKELSNYKEELIKLEQEKMKIFNNRRGYGKQKD